MKESEYIRVRNLSVAMAALKIMSDYHPQGKPYDKHAADASKALSALQTALFGKVRTTEG